MIYYKRELTHSETTFIKLGNHEFCSKTGFLSKLGMFDGINFKVPTMYE